MTGWRSLFDIPDDVAYFNCASVGPLLRAASAAIRESAAVRSHPWGLSVAHWIDDVEERRRLFARLIGADADGIALVPAVSYGAATAARNLRVPSGSRILVPAEDFPSDIYSWRALAAASGAEIVTVSRKSQESWTDAVLSHIDERCSVVAVPNVHWTDGGLFDLVTIGERCRAAGAQLVVDASQSLGVMPIDLDAVRPDFLFAVGYKWMLGPFGLGYLFVAEEHRDGVPLEQNWLARERSEDFARLVDYSDRYRAGARRFDVGERSAFELTRAASVTLAQFIEWKIERVAGVLGKLTDSIEERALELGLRISNPCRGPHMLGLELPECGADVIGILREANVFVGLRGRSLRISPHMYTSPDDMARLFDALERIAAAMSRPALINLETERA